MARAWGIVLCVLALAACGSSGGRSASSSPAKTTSPTVIEQSYKGPAPGPMDHWHAALGVYLCDHWQGGGTWPWPAQTPIGAPARAGTQLYAGLHSHGDGLIHIEPQTTDEMGVHATVGTYFRFGGWTLSATAVSFFGRRETNGDRCGNGETGRVRWSINGTERRGNPADYRIADGDVIVVAFVPSHIRLASLGQPPAVKNLTGSGPPPSPPASG